MKDCYHLSILLLLPVCRAGFRNNIGHWQQQQPSYSIGASHDQPQQPHNGNGFGIVDLPPLGEGASDPFSDANYWAHGNVDPMMYTQEQSPSQWQQAEPHQAESYDASLPLLSTFPPYFDPYQSGMSATFPQQQQGSGLLHHAIPAQDVAGSSFHHQTFFPTQSLSSGWGGQMPTDYPFWQHSGLGKDGLEALMQQQQHQVMSFTASEPGLSTHTVDSAVGATSYMQAPDEEDTDLRQDEGHDGEEDAKGVEDSEVPAQVLEGGVSLEDYWLAPLPITSERSRLREGHRDLLRAEWKARGLSCDLPARHLAEQMAEIKINSGGLDGELSIMAAKVVERVSIGRRRPHYLRDYRYWNGQYTAKIKRLRAAFSRYPNMNAEQIRLALLANFRNLEEEHKAGTSISAKRRASSSSSKQRTMDNIQVLDLEHAGYIWADFAAKRLPEGQALPVSEMAIRLNGYRYEGMTVAQTAMYLKQYLLQVMNVDPDQVTIMFARKSLIHDEDGAESVIRRH